ncbi:Aste57867_24163 [Aphanomyces stellatus]|uniref:Aste57867_24163 protein n=1 Tax=Aphanomyces stellatus TaxID=120398 RepID=A0A485LPX3_9STRA|nr:hypothetical protein As57867_024089 [Aphanomyces stellatus]VFU00805.1 Aste57867_24163 [Aphanomyces stellatus]
MIFAIDVVQEYWAKYQDELREKPLQTKAATSAAMGVCGEVLAHTLKKKPIYTVSFRRMLAFGLYGGVVTGPIMHYWYGFLERMRSGGNKLTPTQKLLMDRLLLTPPFVALTILMLGVLNGASATAARANLRAVYWTTLLMNWKVWTFTQWLSFNYVPPHFRVLWGNAVAVWWNCYLSLSA